MKPVIAIVGAGGHSKCVYECFYQNGLEVLGFFDDDPAKTGLTLINGIKVLGTPEKLIDYPEVTALFIAIGTNRPRMEKYQFYVGKGYTFPNAVHIKSYFSQFSELGQGNFIMGQAVVNPGSKIGDCCIINTSATIGHDCILEDGVQIGPGVNIAGGCTLEREVFVGIGAKLGPKVTIGSRTVVGAGSVVLRDLPANTYASGVPARVRERDE